jgi:hypothetical protein
MHEFRHRRRHQADPIFVVLDLLGDTDTHDFLPGSVKEKV